MTEVLILLLVIGIPIWGIVDASLRPETQWKQAGYNQLVWILVQFFLGPIGAAVYFLVVHPKLIHAQEQGLIMRRRERQAIDRAVRKAETATGLQFCVYLGPADADPRAHAEAMFVNAGLHERPAVLLLVAPNHKRVEVITAPDVKMRLTDEACMRAIDTMSPIFASGRFVEGLSTGLERLAAEAGPPTGPAGTDLPNVLGE